MRVHQSLSCQKFLLLQLTCVLPNARKRATSCIERISTKMGKFNIGRKLTAIQQRNWVAPI